MAQDTLQRFKAGGMAKSVNVNTPDFQEDLQFDGDTINMTSGIQQGIGPRYGMAPIPGHNDQEAVASGKFAGLMRYELGQALLSETWLRTGVFAIYPMRFGGPIDTGQLNTVSTYYVVLIAYTTSKLAGTFFDALLISNVPGSYQHQSTKFYDGLPYTTANQLLEQGYPVLDVELTQQGATINEKVATLLNLTSIGSVKFVSSTPFSISGVEVPMNWMVGEAKTTGGVTTAPSIGLIKVAMTGLSNGGTAFATAGWPPSFNYQNFPLSSRSVSVYALDAQGNQNIDYTAVFKASTSIFLQALTDGSSITNIDLSGVTAVKNTAGVAYGNTVVALYNDTAITCNSSFQGVLSAAGGKAICAIFQDWYRCEFGQMTQFIDLQDNPLPPPTLTSLYAQDGAVTNTAFSKWPTFIRGTPLSAGNGVALGAANTGILRKDTVYEFTYSIFYKRLNYETNVGTPVKIQTDGTNDFVGLQLFSTALGAGKTVFSYNFSISASQVLPWPGTQTNYVGNSTVATLAPVHLNYLEYRFYYRLEGTQEWLPALFVDAAKYWFYPHWTPMFACTGDIGGLTGGQPGGFNDYSPLPKDNWTCTVMYKNRAFWLSDKSLAFSLTNSVMQYAQRNTAACPVGAFKGAIVHAYYGQALQDARLVIFGTASTYVGRFTGDLLQVPVQISADTVANFGLDGSDFVVDYWTSCTAFSYRSAVVAEGLLYFWGQQGIFMDDGVNPIQRISLPLEPDLFGLYDPSQTDAIKVIYNDTTKEIVWFYGPKVPNILFPTNCLIYNTVRQTFLYGKFAGQVDDAQLVKIESSTMPTAGTRTILYSRASTSSTIQRAEFFDQNNRAGDFFPGTELVVKQVSTPVAGQRRFTLAAGFPSLSPIAAGDLIAVQQCDRYATSMASPTDMICEVAAVNRGAGTIDVILPDGVSFDAAITLATNNLYFPIYHAKTNDTGLNGIPFEMSTFYWIPGGMGFWGYWLYLWFVAKVRLLASANPQAIAFSYRTPVSAAFSATEMLDLTDNSDGNWQIYHQLAPGDQNAEGQGIRFKLSGIQIGSEWVLQYVEAHANILDGEQLKIFEG